MPTLDEIRAVMLARTGGQYAGAGHDAQPRDSGNQPTPPDVARDNQSDDKTLASDRSTTRVHSLPERTVESPHRDSRQQTSLDVIENQVGRVVAFDGRLCIWTSRDGDRTRDSYDLRDVARRTQLSVDQVLNALPEFAPQVRGKRNLSDAVEESA